MNTPTLAGSFSDRSTDTRCSFKTHEPVSSSLVKIHTTRQPVKSYKRIATDEEEFREHLGDIIERDFFPRLAEAKGKTVDQDPKNLRLNEYLEVYYNENRCCIPNIEYKEEFETKQSLQAGVPKQKQDQALAAQDPLALAIPSSTLTLNLESWPMSNEEILHHADNKPKINYENTGLQVNPFEAKDQTVKTKLVMVRDHDQGSFNFSEKMLPPRSFVSLTPSPRPGVAESPLMTYGLLEKTPAQIQSSTPKPGGGFSIKPVSAREEIAHKLERHATSRAKVTPSPLSRSKMFYDYRRGATPSSPWLSQQFDNIRSGRMKRIGTKTPTPHRAAPIVRLHGERSKKLDAVIADKMDKNDLTDDLLQIPKLSKDS